MNFGSNKRALTARCSLSLARRAFAVDYATHSADNVIAQGQQVLDHHVQAGHQQ